MGELTLKSYFLIFFLFIPFISFAADLSGKISNNFNNVQNLEEQRREENLKKLKEKNPVFLQKEDKTEEISKPAEMGKCFQIRKIVLDGANSLSSKEKKKLVSDFQGKCLNSADINNILKTVTNFYVDKGMITTRAYLPQQNIGSGTLIIKIFEGLVESFDLIEPEDNIGFEEQTAFPGIAGDLLNLRDLEQGLEQMNRLKSNNATMQLLPGSKPGFSNVIINNTPSLRIHGNIGYNNDGSESTGKEQVKLGIQMDDLLGVNDFISVGTNTSLNEPTQKYSRSYDTFISIPYGYNTFSFSHTSFKYKNTIDGRVRSFETSGISNTDYFSIDRVLSRGKRDKFGGTISLTLKESKNYIEDAKIEASSRKLSVFKIGFNITKYFSGSSLSAGAYYYKGLKFADALEDRDSPPDSSKAQFQKGTFNMSLSTSFPSKKVFYQSSISLQYSDDRLYGSEQFSVGGQYSVRGFHQYGVSSDSGIYWRNEVNLPLFNNHWTPYVALDIGHAYKSYLEQYSYGTLAGGAVGIKASYNYLRAGLIASLPLRYPSKLTPEPLTVLFNIEFFI